MFKANIHSFVHSFIYSGQADARSRTYIKNSGNKAVDLEKTDHFTIYFL